MEPAFDRRYATVGMGRRILEPALALAAVGAVYLGLRCFIPAVEIECHTWWGGMGRERCTFTHGTLLDARVTRFEERVRLSLEGDTLVVTGDGQTDRASLHPGGFDALIARDRVRRLFFGTLTAGRLDGWLGPALLAALALALGSGAVRGGQVWIRVAGNRLEAQRLRFGVGSARTFTFAPGPLPPLRYAKGAIAIDGGGTLATCVPRAVYDRICADLSRGR